QVTNDERQKSESYASLRNGQRSPEWCAGSQVSVAQREERRTAKVRVCAKAPAHFNRIEGRPNRPVQPCETDNQSYCPNTQKQDQRARAEEAKKRLAPSARRDLPRQCRGGYPTHAIECPRETDSPGHPAREDHGLECIQ